MPQEVYCELIGKEAGMLAKKIEVGVDFGESKGLIESIIGTHSMKDDRGKILKFNSMIDALNHMGRNGWLFVNAYTITVKNDNIYHYVMRKVIEN